MNGRTTSAVLVSVFVAATFFVLNCAEIAPPPGGEEDKIGPTIIQTLPENGALNVEPSDEITFWFSEGILKPGTAKPVFISPRQSEPPKVSWKSDRMIIKLAEPFEANQTYVVTLTTEITDWRRNKMDSTVTIAFSTGQKIDTGAIGGFVMEQGAGKQGVLVGLYEQSSETEQINYDSVFPEYISQTSGDGSFKFKYLPEKNFRMVAFEDINRNERYNPEEEKFAVPDRAIDFTSGQSLNELFLELSTPIAGAPKISSASVTSDGLIKIRINRSIGIDFIKSNLTKIEIQSKTGQGKSLPPQSILESHLDTSSVLTLFVGAADTGRYSISIQYDSVKSPITFDEFFVPSVKDKTTPEIVKFTPDETSHFLNRIEIAALFSEPIDQSKISDQTFVLTGDTLSVIPISWNWRDPFHISFETDKLEAGRAYTMTIAEFEIADLAGNLMGDSLLSFKFSVMDPDSLGSISGNTVVDIPGKVAATRQMTFVNVNGKQSFDFAFESDSFLVELPAGKYLMSGYLDENRNTKRDLGISHPYFYSETFGRSMDTITVRARFETAGIEFRFK